MRSKYKSSEPSPLEPEAYTVAIYFFMFLLLVSFLGSSYLNRYPDLPVIEQTIED